MSESLFLKLTEGGVDDAQVRLLLAWQLGRDEQEIDCALIGECLRFLEPDAPGMTQKDALLRQMKGRIASRRRRLPGRALIIAALVTLLLALAAGAAAYKFARGTLDFNEDFGWGIPITHQEGAQTLVTEGALAHREFEHVTLDVLEAAYDGSELRIVYRLTTADGPVEDRGDMLFVPGAAQDGVHVCDYLTVNGQNAYFDDVYEAMGEAENEALYYLQTSLRAWGVDVSGADELTIGLPMLGEAERGKAQEMISFTIPAAVPQGMVRGAQLVSFSAGGRSVRLEEARFSPLSGYVRVFLSDITEKQMMNDARGFGYALDAAGKEIPGSHLEGRMVYQDGGALIGYRIMPPEEGWPQSMTLVFEMAKEPDILIMIEPE